MSGAFSSQGIIVPAAPPDNARLAFVRAVALPLAVGLVLLLFWSISLRNLTVIPPVYEDEPWQASTAHKLATEGVFGSDLFAGFHGMERHYYGFMPVHPLVMASVFRLGGLGLFQARLEAVALGLLTLALTYSLARRLFKDPRIGLLAILFLVSIRTTGLTTVQLSGILFVDVARIARYDMVVPVLGLASLHAYLTARRGASRRGYFLAGLLAGLSGLAHLYGLFWLLVLAILALWDARRCPAVENAGNSKAASGCNRRERDTALACILLGFVLPWLPYAAYVLGDLNDWRGQTRGYGNRFDLLNLGWYLENLRAEPHRYGPGLGPVRLELALRLGFWSALVTLPAALGALLWRALRHRDLAARVVVVPLVVFPALFAALIRLKLSNYLVVVVPLAAIAAAWAAVTLWSRLSGTTRPRWARLALIALLMAVVVEGSTRFLALESAASTSTPYYDFVGRVRSYIPPGSRVLGLHNYWLGLDDLEYRSFVVPLSWTDPQNELGPLTFDEALEQLAPDVVLLDERMRAYFANLRGADEEIPARFYQWLSRHDGYLAGRVEDPTYGLMEIYRLGRRR